MATEKTAHPRRRRGRPPVAESPEARAGLLEAAADVFAERGFRAATVDQIVTAAGLSKGTFYWHFANKEELFHTLLDERLDQPVRAMMELTHDAPAERPTAPDVSRALEGLVKSEREVLLLAHEYWMSAVRDEALGERYRRRQAALREMLAGALTARHEKTGVPMSVPAHELATAFVALGEGLAGAALVDPESVRPGLFGEILSLVYDGLEARARASR